MRELNTDGGIEQHGGNTGSILARWPNAPTPLIDLSTGINPYAYPFAVIEPEWLHRLAQAQEVQAAQEALSHYYGVKELALASGMQPLMFALSCLRLKEYGKSRVAIVAPTYTEHARVWNAAGHEVVTIVADDCDVVIVCNPNNPDGRQLLSSQLLALAEKLQSRKGWLIVDESFGDLMPELSVAKRAAASENIAVLRSCGKFFGAAGLRVSSVTAPQLWMEWLRSVCGPWPVSTAACKLLPGMVADAQWIAQMRTRLEQESATWRGLLARYFTIAGHTPLFTLVESPDAGAWAEAFGRQGILVRRFGYNQGWLRLGLPDNQYLGRIGDVLAKGL